VDGHRGVRCGNDRVGRRYKHSLPGGDLQMNPRRRMMIMDTIYIMAGIVAVSLIMGVVAWGIVWLLN